MSKEKTESLRGQIRDLIVTAVNQEIPLSSIGEIMKEEMQRIKEEIFEKSIQRSVKEQIFREKAIKTLDVIKEVSDSIGNCPMMLRNVRQRKNCLEILCVFYTKGIDIKPEIYTELEERLQVKKKAIDHSMEILYDFISEYYHVSSQNLKKEKLQEFMKEIEKIF